MLEHLGDLGLQFEVFEAIDGSELSGKDLKRVYSPVRSMISNGRLMSKGDVGCALSHQAIYARIVDDLIDFALVLEDDVRLEPRVLDLLPHVSSLELNWDLINLHTDGELSQSPQGGVPSHGFVFRSFVSYANRTSAYLITRPGARKLLKFGPKVYMPADGPTGRTNVSRLRSWAVDETLVQSTDSPSTIPSSTTKVPAKIFFAIHNGLRPTVVVRGLAKKLDRILRFFFPRQK